MAERAERAALGAAASREKAHPAVGAQRRDVRRSAVRCKQEQQQGREMLSREAQKRGAGAFIEGVAKIQLASDPVRVS